jgi:hypothetical protein
MDLRLTLALAAGALAIAVFSGWMGAKPPNPHKGPRLIPHRLIMVTATAILLLLLVHAVNLLGVRTGR